MTDLTFATWKAGEPARAMFRKLNLEETLQAASSWRSLRAMIVDFNGADRGDFVKLVRRCDGVCSSGERILLHAICYAADFAWLADKLGKGKVWQNFDRVGGEWRHAVAACIAAGDSF